PTWACLRSHSCRAALSSRKLTVTISPFLRPISAVTVILRRSSRKLGATKDRDTTWLAVDSKPTPSRNPTFTWILVMTHPHHAAGSGSPLRMFHGLGPLGTSDFKFVERSIVYFALGTSRNFCERFEIIAISRCSINVNLLNS